MIITGLLADFQRLIISVIDFGDGAGAVVNGEVMDPH
jgi:hypothetical protein